MGPALLAPMPSKSSLCSTRRWLRASPPETSASAKSAINSRDLILSRLLLRQKQGLSEQSRDTDVTRVVLPKARGQAGEVGHTATSSRLGRCRCAMASCSLLERCFDAGH